MQQCIGNRSDCKIVVMMPPKIDIGHPEQGRLRGSQRRTRALRNEGRGQSRDANTDHECREKPLYASRVEREQRVWSPQVDAPQRSRDDIPRYDKEEIDPEIAAWKPSFTQMEQQHRYDGDGSKAVELGSMREDHGVMVVDLEKLPRAPR